MSRKRRRTNFERIRSRFCFLSPLPQAAHSSALRGPSLGPRPSPEDRGGSHAHVPRPGPLPQRPPRCSAPESPRPQTHGAAKQEDKGTGPVSRWLEQHRGPGDSPAGQGHNGREHTIASPTEGRGASCYRARPAGLQNLQLGWRQKPTINLERRRLLLPGHRQQSRPQETIQEPG